MVGVFHRFEKLDSPDLFFGDLGVDHQLDRFEHHSGFDAVRDVEVLLDRFQLDPDVLQALYTLPSTRSESSFYGRLVQLWPEERVLFLA